MTLVDKLNRNRIVNQIMGGLKFINPNKSKCPYCNGERVSKWSRCVACADNETRIRECKECGGSGIVPKKICSRCKGEGFIEITIKKPEYGTFTDPRDGKAYKTVKIGDKTWLAENLNWENAGIWYKCNIYGRLYTWKEAMEAAPPGWHLPTDEDWERLTWFAGGRYGSAGKRLKTKDGWDGTDEFGFSVLPGGHCIYNGEFDGIGINGRWWSATEVDGENAYYRLMCSGDAKVYRDFCYKGDSFSVRLVRD